jgi:octaprenyl-diphosphate synthase
MRHVTLSEIARPVERQITEFNKRFSKTMISEVPLVNLVAKYLVRTKGKQVRPLLVLLSAELCGGVNDATYRAASLVELLHTATLVHDDVIDEADTRRGFASIRALWRNKVGVLMGDYLLARGLLLTVETSEYHFLKITSTAVRRMSEGELYQIQKARQLNIDEAGYFRIIGDKTASLISTCCEMGAASVSMSDETRARREALRNYGEYVGIAFQIRDDLFDYESAAGTIGKPVAIDLKEKKLTLPLIHALSKIDKSEARRVRSLIKSGKAAKDSYRDIVNMVEREGGLEYARLKAHEYADKAKAELNIFADSPAKASLLNFVDFVMEREF